MRVAEFLKMGQSLQSETYALSQALLEMESLCKAGECDREIFLSYLNLKADVSSKVKRMMEIKKDIIDLIYKIENPVYRTLLLLRYVKGHTMEKCSEIMDYEERHIYRVHKKALEEAEKCYFS